MPHNIEEFIADVPSGLVALSEYMSLQIDERLGAIMFGMPEAMPEREAIRSQIVAFVTKYGYVPDFNVEPK